MWSGKLEQKVCDKLFLEIIKKKKIDKNCVKMWLTTNKYDS